MREFEKPEIDDICYSQKLGEFSLEADKSFEKHLENLRRAIKVTGNYKEALKVECLWYGRPM